MAPQTTELSSSSSAAASTSSPSTKPEGESGEMSNMRPLPQHPGWPRGGFPLPLAQETAASTATNPTPNTTGTTPTTNSESIKTAKLSPNEEITQALKAQAKEASRRRRKANGYPRRPLSAYNFFFQLARDRLVAADTTADARFDFTQEEIDTQTRAFTQPRHPSHRRTHGKVGFSELAHRISKEWNKLPEKYKVMFQKRAGIERERYFQDVKDWKKNHQAEQLQETRARMRHSKMLKLLEKERDAIAAMHITQFANPQGTYPQATQANQPVGEEDESKSSEYLSEEEEVIEVEAPRSAPEVVVIDEPDKPISCTPDPQISGSPQVAIADVTHQQHQLMLQQQRQQRQQQQQQEQQQQQQFNINVQTAAGAGVNPFSLLSTTPILVPNGAGNLVLARQQPSPVIEATAPRPSPTPPAGPPTTESLVARFRHQHMQSNQPAHLQQILGSSSDSAPVSVADLVRHRESLVQQQLLIDQVLMQHHQQQQNQQEKDQQPPPQNYPQQNNFHPQQQQNYRSQQQQQEQQNFRSQQEPPQNFRSQQQQPQNFRSQQQQPLNFRSQQQEQQQQQQQQQQHYQSQQQEQQQQQQQQNYQSQQQQQNFRSQRQQQNFLSLQQQQNFLSLQQQQNFLSQQQQQPAPPQQNFQNHMQPQNFQQQQSQQQNFQQQLQHQQMQQKQQPRQSQQNFENQQRILQMRQLQQK